MNLSKIKKWCWVNKEGFGVGLVIAIILYYMQWTLPINFPFNGIPKLIVMIIILGILGAIMDSIWEPSK
jgi:hypothetical protein